MIKDSPYAFWNGFIFKKVFYSSSTGYDPSLNYYHPGMFLLLKMIEEFCLDSYYEAVDFGFGEAEYKRIFCTEKWQESSVYIFAPTFKGLRLKAIKLSTVIASQTAKKVVKRFKTLQHVKRTWRHRLTPR